MTRDGDDLPRYLFHRLEGGWTPEPSKRVVKVETRWMTKYPMEDRK